MQSIRRKLSTYKWDKGFLNTVLIIALPLIIQNLVGQSLNLIDTIMVSALGDAAYSGVSQANRFTFVVMIIIFGTASGTSIFLSQFWGAKQADKMKQAHGLGIVALLLSSVPLMFVGIFFAGDITGLFLKPGPSHIYASQYLRLVSPMFPFMALSNAYISLLRSEEKTKYTMYSSIISMLVNTVFNYLLIEGHLGFPRLEAEGAAIATVLAAIVQLLCVLYFYRRKSSVGKAKIKELFGFKKDFIKSYIKTSAPVIVNEFMWSLGVAIYSIFYGMRGDSAVSAVGVYNTIENFSFVVMYAIMNTTAVMVGKELGAKRLKSAKIMAGRFAFGAIVFSMAMSALLFIFKDALPNIFSGLSIETKQSATNILMFALSAYLFRTINTIVIVGIFRAGGDTIFCFWIDIVSVWLVGIPLLALATVFTAWPIHILVFVALSEEFIKSIFVFSRYKSGRWIRSLTE